MLTVLLATTTAAYAAAPGDTVVLPVRDALRALPVQYEDLNHQTRAMKLRHLELASQRARGGVTSFRGARAGRGRQSVL
ncbi:hypothetical protein [Streptomyces tailanensis]|uniref:hypothetical protein n=1 Tax=Streptomyces tailanensis TaxID=2569858 RepID=UPI001FE61E04|nr:hypothetical protein [Streptomyces tailanensis]